MTSSGKVAAVILARATSARLPGKHLLRIGGRSLLEILVGRLRRTTEIDKLVAAIPEGDAHLELATRFLEMGVAVWRGSESDVAGRFAAAAENVGATWALRVNGDCPFQAPDLLDRGVSLAKRSGADFVTNIPGRTWPYGVSLELVRTDAYRGFRKLFDHPDHVEHVTAWLYRNPDAVRTETVLFQGDPSLRAARLTIDTPQDFETMSKSVINSGEDPVEISTDRIAACWLAAKSTLEETPC